MENGTVNTEKTAQRPNLILTTLILAAGIMIVLGCSQLYSFVIEPRLGFELPELVSDILAQMIVPYGIGLALCLLLYKLLPRSGRSEINRSGFTAGDMVKGLFVQEGVGMVLAIAINIVYMILTGSAPEQTRIDFGSPYMAFLLLVFAPVIEELLFRRLVIDRLRRFGKYPAVLISAVMFAVPHIFSQSAAAFGMTLAAGLVWGYVYYKTNKLLPCVIMHSLFNIINGYGASFLTSHGTALTAVYMLIYAVIFPVTAAVLVIKNRESIFSRG